MERLLSEELQEAVDSAIACFEEADKLSTLSEAAKKCGNDIVDRKLYSGNWLSTDRAVVLQCEKGLATMLYLDDPTAEDGDDDG